MKNFHSQSLFRSVSQRQDFVLVLSTSFEGNLVLIKCFTRLLVLNCFFFSRYLLQFNILCEVLQIFKLLFIPENICVTKLNFQTVTFT